MADKQKPISLHEDVISSAFLSGVDVAFLRDVAAEVVRAREQWPGRRHLITALMEEVGELAKALLDCEGTERVRAEAIQVAGLAMRIAVEGEEVFDDWDV